MQRTLLIAALIALAAAPAAAQGKSKAHPGQSEFRTNDDRRGIGRSDDDRDDDDRDDDDRDKKRASHGRRDSYGTESQRTYIDSRGLECREKNKVKKDGRRSSETRCKEPKHRKNDRSARDSRSGNQRCVYLDSRCDRLPSGGGNYPRSRVPPTSTSGQRSVADILGEIAASRAPR